jgi:valyl-tRNA synthetase
VEAVKPRLAAGDEVAAVVLGRVLSDLLALLHPLAPFVTEAVWQRLRAATVLELPAVLAHGRWPDGAGLQRDAQAEADLALAQAVLSSVRKLRQQSNVPDRKPVRVTVALPDQAAVDGLLRARELLLRLGALESLVAAREPARPVGAAADVSEGVEVLLDLEGLIDRQAQRADLQRKLDRTAQQLEALAVKLGNENFTGRASAEVVARERARLQELGTERARLEGLLAALRP